MNSLTYKVKIFFQVPATVVAKATGKPQCQSGTKLRSVIISTLLVFLGTVKKLTCLHRASGKKDKTNLFVRHVVLLVFVLFLSQGSLLEFNKKNSRASNVSVHHLCDREEWKRKGGGWGRKTM